jgi:hypothetical protein
MVDLGKLSPKSSFVRIILLTFASNKNGNINL